MGDGDVVEAVDHGAQPAEVAAIEDEGDPMQVDGVTMSQILIGILCRDWSRNCCSATRSERMSRTTRC